MFECNGAGTRGRREARGTVSVALVLLLPSEHKVNPSSSGKQTSVEAGMVGAPVHVLAAWATGGAV